VVLGEQVPKVAALHDPERFALLWARPMQAFSILFRWFVDLLDWATRIILRLVGLEMSGEHMMLYTVEELKQILSDSEKGGIIEVPEREMLHAIFNLDEILVRQVMIPRTEVIAVEADTSLEEMIAIATETTHTKLPVYENSLDQIFGVVHVNDLLKAMQSNDSEDCAARGLSRETIFAPETIRISTLLQQFREKRQHIAIVLDEYGGTAGIVTLEDLLEEIVGEVSDPFDELTPEIQTTQDGSALIDGLALIEEVNEELGLNLADPNYDTIAGYVLGKLDRIARTGDIVEGDGIRLKVESMDGLRINQIRMTRLEESQDEPTQTT
jgi:CBS domain containing-hemolysin-like protein